MKVVIEEVLRKTIEVPDTTEALAIEYATELYRNEDVVLDADDFAEVSFTIERS